MTNDPTLKPLLPIPGLAPPNPTQAGTVLVFKPGVTVQQAEQALKALAPLLEYTPRVNTFDPEWGEPVWYIP